MAFIKVRDDETIESALRRFKKKVDNEGIIKDYKEKQFFMKPSMKKRLKRKESERKQKQKQRRKTYKLDNSR